jgi:hypothetical protein
MNKNKAILTFDVEFPYSSNFLKKYLRETDKTDCQIENYFMLLLDLLKRYNQKATFFVLGQLAEKYPALIKTISSAGHEIASHGYSHNPLNELDRDMLQEELDKTNQIIKGLIDQKLKGFRAPNFSLNPKTQWAVEVIKNNFQYDSSIHPLKRNFLKKEILEVPSSLGGIYFRILPLWLYCFLLKISSKNKIPALYFHPLDLFNDLPKIESVPWWKKKIKYWGIKKSWKKFEKLIKKFDFLSIDQYLNENSSH